MPEFVQANWPYLIVAAVLVIAVLAFFLASNRKTTVINQDKVDVLDDGAAPAARNQALIDTPAAAQREAVPAQDPAPASAAAPTPEPARASGTGDDLTTIKGLGPKLAATLNELGITSFAQIASWSDSDIDKIDSQLGRFEGRIRRDNWVEQAKLLSAGDESGFAQQFGNNG